ncbi:MAG: D-alanyl-D-alanine carboxypeptidase, partial [Actinobacteria bacterium]|nr:D-alanyl-D-alanine carboxypeptidase [Actinomycetota bacterium]
MRRFLALLFSFIFLSIHPATAAEVLPQPFFNYLGSKYLANPGVILVDPSSNEVLYQSGADKPRTPASVLKLFTTASIALTLDSKTTFQTAIYKTDKRGVFVIWGENDPWITSSAKAANANQRAYMPKLIKAAFASDKKLKKIKLIYKGVNNSDIRDAKKALKRRASVTYQRIGKDVAVEEIVQEQLAVITSPPLN